MAPGPGVSCSPLFHGSKSHLSTPGVCLLLAHGLKKDWEKQMVVFCCFVFRKDISFCSPGYPGTPYIAQAGPSLTEILL